MKRIKSAPANIAEMVNRRKVESIKPKKSNENKIFFFGNSKSEKQEINTVKNIKNLNNIKSLNSNTERVTNIVSDVINDIFSLSFEETAFLGIILNLLNNTFRKDKLKDLSAILIQNFIKYLMMYYLHHYVLNDYIEKHSSVNLIDFVH